MDTKQNSIRLTLPQQWGFIVLRIIIGWHFLYEGIVKLMDPDWSAESFLNGSQGFLSEAFQWMASQPAVLEVVNVLNIWGLILIGVGLFLGFFARTAVYAGILLLFFYYIAYPP
ncbi:MAG: DoxX family membrane protein, partial [Bacteroidales bacterium]|nr:DoxX family membrane protein [Bacteroidales bacterium]